MRYLYFENRKTGEKDGLMKVEGYDPRRIMKIKAGMAINIGPDWAVGDGDLTEDEVDALKAD